MADYGNRVQILFRLIKLDNHAISCDIHFFLFHALITSLASQLDAFSMFFLSPTSYIDLKRSVKKSP